MAHDYYLYIEGKAPVKGEASGDFKDQIQISKFTVGLSAPTDFSTGGIAGHVHLEHAEFEFDSSVASPVLFNAISSNETFKQVILSCRKTGVTGKLVMYLQWRFQQARIVSIKMNGDAEKAGDTMHLAYAAFEVWCGPQKQDGTVGNGSTAAYDAGQNATVKSSLPITKFPPK